MGTLPLFPPELLTGVRNCLVDYGGCKQGDQVVILSELGTYVDPMVVQAQQAVLAGIGAEVQVIWTRKLLHSWWEELSPAVRAAVGAADVVVQNICTIGKTHLLDMMLNQGVRRIRNYATDVELASSDWARFPVAVQDVVELRVNSWLNSARQYRVTTPAGTDIQGEIDPRIRAWRKDTKRSGGLNVSFPPSVFRATESQHASGVIVVESTYPWGARLVGLPELRFDHPVRLTVEDNRVVHIEGGWEAEAYRRLIEDQAQRVGDRAYRVDSWHTGTSPRAMTPFHPSMDPDRYDHLIHNHEGWFHFHIGSLSDKDFSGSQLAAHVNAVVRFPTVYLDGEKLSEDGRLVIWDEPEIRAAAEPYGGAQALFAPRPLVAV